MNVSLNHHFVAASKKAPLQLKSLFLMVKWIYSHNILTTIGCKFPIVCWLSPLVVNNNLAKLVISPMISQEIAWLKSL